LKALGLTFLLQLHERTDEVMGQEWLMTVFVDKERSGNARPMTSQSRVAQFRFVRWTAAAFRQNSVLGFGSDRRYSGHAASSSRVSMQRKW